MLDKIERATELPMMVLAFVMIPLLVAPLFWDLSSRAEAVVLALDGFIWALFATDLAIKVAIAPQRLKYVRQHWLDVMIVLVPIVRPLRILRIILYGCRVYRGAVWPGPRGFPAGIRNRPRASPSNNHHPRGERRQLGVGLLLGRIVVGRRNGDDGGIRATVVPETQIGRAFAYVLMLGGIGIFGALTANFASILVQKGRH